MFCNQCEQTAKGLGCTRTGVCGKGPEVAALQDLLIYALRGLAQTAWEGRKVGITDRQVDGFIVQGMFATLTNVDFDPGRFEAWIRKAVNLREGLKERVKAAGGISDFTQGPATLTLESSREGLIRQGEVVGLLNRLTADEDLQTALAAAAGRETALGHGGTLILPGLTRTAAFDPDILSLQQLLTYGIMGVCAYADHARILGKEDDAVYAFVEKGLAAPVDNGLTLKDWLDLVLECGAVNLRTMELLDQAHTETYGHPRPTRVPLGVKKGKAILVSGHDLKDLEEVLKQSRDMGIFVYTHGEMLPAHGYPELKKYPHFYGHFGTAWVNQQKEFPQFPGAVLMTTNCLQPPKESYRDRLFTTGLVGWPGLNHLTDKDFTPLIEKALSLPGFPEDLDRGEVTVGFGHEAVLGLADRIIEAVKKRKIRHFFLVGGCDGAKGDRNYYARLVEQIPEDCLVLTLACGKFRFFDRKLGEIEGLPRLVDIGQCNDAYSAVRIAQALAEAFDCGVNDLPLSLILSWYEQKAVAILLTLLHLGIRHIRLGPSLPAFISPQVLKVLSEQFDLKPITTPEEDLRAILG